MSEAEKRAAQMAFIDTDTTQMDDFYRQLIWQEYHAEKETLADVGLTQDIAQEKYPEMELQPEIEPDQEIDMGR